MSAKPAPVQDLKEKQCIAEAANLMVRVLNQLPVGSREDVGLHQFTEATHEFAAKIAANRFQTCMSRQPSAPKAR